MSGIAVAVVLAVVVVAAVLLARSFGNRGPAPQQAQAPKAAPQRATLPAFVPKSPTLSQARAYDQQARQAAASCERAISAAQQRAAADVSFAFIQRQEALARESERLEEQLQQHMSRRLEASSFHYYTQLHFESMLAADNRHLMYEEACRALDEVGGMIVAVGKGTVRVSSQEKNELYRVKDAIKASRDAHLANTRLLNNQTHDFKERIRNECGPRGEKWAEERERNARRR